jgi:hypothetical protein
VRCTVAASVAAATEVVSRPREGTVTRPVRRLRREGFGVVAGRGMGESAKGV